ncbi:MAG: URC4/urg3 family protein [Cyanobacteria bacterium P01_A01_bin.114]
MLENTASENTALENTAPENTALEDVVNYLRSPQAIRERSAQLFELACDNELSHFRCDLSRLDAVADFVVAVTQEAYPTGQIPVHSRWRHLELHGQSLLTRLGEAWQVLPSREQVRARLDLVIVSVLLDAGAGSRWRYVDPISGESFQRSEGLAIASFQAFAQGLFSADPKQPWRVDAAALQQLSVGQLADAFQVTSENPLVGLEGRCQLLQSLGNELIAQPRFFGASQPRLGNLVDYFLSQADGGDLKAAQILKTLLVSLGQIWPGRVAISGTNLGDVWPHEALPDNGLGGQLVPFHKLSQWLTYSLLEPLESLGLTITGQSELTGLAEYRNGGLCIDLGLFVPKDPQILSQPHPPDSPVVVEWRALTVIALDRIAERVRDQLSAPDLTLPEILQGGTWSAGRRIAKQKRPDGTPPIQILSDGTVF